MGRGAWRPAGGLHGLRLWGVGGSERRVKGGAAATTATRTVTGITGVPAVEAGWASLGIVGGADARWDHRAGLAGSRTGQVETEGVGAGRETGEVGRVKTARGRLGTDSPGAGAECKGDGVGAGVREEVVQAGASDGAVGQVSTKARAVTYSRSRREGAEGNKGLVLISRAERGEVTEASGESGGRGDRTVKWVDSGRADVEPNGPLRFAGRETGGVRGSSTRDRAGGRGLTQDYRVQRARRGRGGRGSRPGSRLLLAAAGGRVGRACARRAKEYSINEADYFSNGEVN